MLSALEMSERSSRGAVCGDTLHRELSDESS
jgi:hypothetical protein